MKKITMFVLPGCPHCARAFQWMEQANQKHPEFRGIEIEIVDETMQVELANSFDYYYVPTYYIDGKKVHEGVASLEMIENVLQEAFNG